MTRVIAALLCLRLLTWGTCGFAADPVKEAEMVRKSVVRIQTEQQVPSYAEPWSPGSRSGGVGTGFILDGRRIMTNAHVVSNAYVIQLKREGLPKQYSAKVKHIAHDCDLAILEVTEDADAFFKDSVALQLGTVPKLNSSVAAYGYPIGGRRMSITKGVVSRIEFNAYSHSGLDSHLTIQVDAAINPGNSGGPIVQDGKVVGVAFQGYGGNVAQNTGYMIPTPVITRMLKDIEDGHYDGYMELAVYHMNLQNKGQRQFLGLPDDERGVLVTDVMKFGSGYGKLKPGDVILGIDGHEVDSGGNILLDSSKVQLAEVIERKFQGDKVKFDLLRDGKKATETISLKKAAPFGIYSWNYDKRPTFVMFAGISFQPLGRNLMTALAIQHADTKYTYDFYIQDKVFVERPQIIVLSSVLPDPINAGARVFAHSIVDKINGVKIKVLEDVSKAFAKKVKHHRIDLLNGSRPIIIDASKVAEARKRILERYQITREGHLGTKGAK
jgi:S1-C subfamily serine protease